ncbi:MAG: Gfo/Idh/MocA family oxidoreductase [Planctomycetia bacterium]|nr:Gfo/Idh/MocA family oxidoreductase [Planctomycetia bacterium]
MLSRRQFLQTSTALAAGAAIVPGARSSSKLYAADSPNEQLRMGCIGVGSMGCGDAGHFNRLCNIVALADVDEEYGIARAMRAGIGCRDEKRPDVYKDYRRVLERDDIDVVSVVTPDHWHVKIAIEALQSGKHVFCQKPLTLTLEENILIREACRKYGKVFQVGTQQRSQRDQFMKAAIMIRKGFLGEIRNIVCDIGGSPTSGPLATEAVPASLDWEMWQGPAPRHDFIPRRCHYEYRWWYEYSGGKFTDWGAHHIDCALWALNLQTQGTGPISFDGTKAKHPVAFKDGYPEVDNQYNTSHDFDIVCKFENGMEMHVVSGSPDGNGILFEGTKGRIHVSRGRIKGGALDTLPQDAITPEDYVALYNGKPYEGHKENFIRCIREGGKPVSDVESHVQAMHCCHLCGIAARLNREVRWDPAAEKIVGDDQAASFFGREMYRGYEMPTIS